MIDGNPLRDSSVLLIPGIVENVRWDLHSGVRESGGQHGTMVDIIWIKELFHGAKEAIVIGIIVRLQKFTGPKNHDGCDG